MFRARAVRSPGQPNSSAPLACDIYDRLYIRPSSRKPLATDVLAQRDLLASLSAANAGRGCWEPGWTIRRIGNDGFFGVAKGGLTFWATGAEVRTSGDLWRAGEACRIWVAHEPAR